MVKKKPNPVLRRFHARGKCANMRGAAQKAKNKRTWGILECLGAETSTARNRLMEARKFARLCYDKEFNFLCRLGQKNGRPLTRFHVLQLIRVAEQEQRKNLARKCAAESWSVRRLEMEVRRHVHRRISINSGRRHTPPKSVDEALIVTERLAAGWIRWVSVLEEDENKPSKKRITVETLPEPIGKKLVAVSKRVKTLRDEIAKTLNRQSPKSRKTCGRRTR